MKKCSRCQQLLEIDNFYKQGHRCKPCQKEYDKERRSTRRVKMKDRVNNKRYRKQHVEQLKEYQKEYDKNRKESKKIWRKEYDSRPDVIARRRRMDNKRYRNDNSFRLYKSMSANINKSLQSNKAGRKWETLVDFTLKDLRMHLEVRFQKGMNWDNYGKGVGRWNVDHVVPLKYRNPNGSFYWNQEELIITSSDTFRNAWALKNLQPKWAIENVSKLNRSIG